MVASSTLPNYGAEICELSPHATYFSTVIGAYISTIISGITGGYLVAFFIGWISWLATLRILIVCLWQVGVVLSLKPTKGGKQWHAFASYAFCRIFENDWYIRGTETSNSDVTFFGWFGWVWAVFYAPTIQVLWLVKNWNDASPVLLLVRGLSVSVVALPLTMDTRARYGRALGKQIGGKVTEWLFSVVTTVSLVTLGVISTIEVSMGVVESLPSSQRWSIVWIVLFLVAWAWGSFQIFPPRDVPFTTGSLLEILAGFAMGCFAGLFVAAPSFAAMQAAPRYPGLSVQNYIKCQSITWWERAIAILP